MAVVLGKLHSNPKASPNPNPNPTRGTIFLGDNWPDNMGSLAKIINKTTFLLSDESNKNSIIDENKKLDVTVSHTKQITSKLKELYTNETKALEICNKQEFRVIQIRKSINPFLNWKFSRRWTH